MKVYHHGIGFFDNVILCIAEFVTERNDGIFFNLHSDGVPE